MAVSKPRPPSAAPYITPTGMRALREEFQRLWTVERPQVTAAVHEAAKNGDRSENGDYIYGKRRLREIDRRLHYLGKRLATLKVVDRPPADVTRVYFGAWVSLEDQHGRVVTYRIVGTDEIDPGKGHISIDSPLARSLLGKTLAQVAVAGAETATADPRLRIIAIRYESA